jgi:ABC-type lipoprotein export system ATPase subunit
MLALFRSVHQSTDVTIVMVTHALALMSHGTCMLEMISGRLGADCSDRGDPGALRVNGVVPDEDRGS